MKLIKVELIRMEKQGDEYHFLKSDYEIVETSERIILIPKKSIN